MSAAASFLPRYTPAQIEAHRRIQAIREKHKASMMARLRARQEAEEAAARKALEAAMRDAEIRRRAAEDIEKARQASAALAVCRRYKKVGLSPTRKQEALERVAKHYGLDPADIEARGRVQIITTARAHAMAIIAREAKDVSLVAIARSFGNDHSTVIYAIRRYNNALGQNVRGLGGLPDSHKGFYACLFRLMPGEGGE
jgi:chromosomal replication initiation ATPase DnaA